MNLATNNRCYFQNKVQYATPEVAQNMAQLFRVSRGEAIRAYQCERCGLWHLTHKRGVKAA